MGITDELAWVHGVEERRLHDSVIEDDGVVSVAESVWEGTGLTTAEGHRVGRGRGSDGLNARRGREGLWGGRCRFGLRLTFAPGHGGKGNGGGHHA